MDSVFSIASKLCYHLIVFRYATKLVSSKLIVFHLISYNVFDIAPRYIPLRKHNNQVAITADSIRISRADNLFCDVRFNVIWKYSVAIYNLLVRMPTAFCLQMTWSSVIVLLMEQTKLFHIPIIRQIRIQYVRIMEIDIRIFIRFPVTRWRHMELWIYSSSHS
jgi:hypothetical protein